MADDWDLQAVVRGCTTNSASSCSSTSTTFNFISSTSTTTTTTCGGENSIMFPQQDENFSLIQDLYERNNCGSQDLHDLYRPFFPKPSPPLSPQSIIPISSLSVLGLQDLSQQIHRHNHHHQQQQQQMLKPKQNLSMVGPYRSKTSNASPQPQNSRSKRRKNQMKRVIEIPAEALSSDMWSWRKYGQKPIKGSPYPRGYYRCSTSKGCLARKQVERNRSDPGMFIVTYTAEHNHPMPTHRNSLAGSSRQKPSTSGDPNKPSGSPLASSDSVSPEYEKLDIENCKDEMIEDDEDENMSNSPSCMNLEDDFFDGLEELVGIAPPAAPISNTFSQNTQFPWFTNNATTTAAGGV